MAGLRSGRFRGSLEGMLKVDQVHVIRHKVLVEGRSQRQVAKELGISRLTVRKYLEEAVPIRKETAPRARPVWDEVSARVAALLAESAQWTGGKQQLTATRLHELLVGRGPSGRRHARQRGGRRVEAPAPRGVRAADVSARRSRRGRLLRGARRSRRHAPQGVALSDAADVLGPRLRVDLRAPGPDQFSRWPRAGLRAFRGRARPDRVRQSPRGRRPDPRRAASAR